MRAISSEVSTARTFFTKGATLLDAPADAKGKKLRTYPNEMQRWLLEAMGFTVQIMPVTDPHGLKAHTRMRLLAILAPSL